MPIPLALQRKVKIVNAVGGVNHDSLPIRENGLNSPQLTAMLPNGTIVIVVDTRKDAALIKPYYDAGTGWGMFQMVDGALFAASPSGQNWCEYKSHLEDVIDEEPQPTYTLVEMELYSIKIEFEPKFRVSVIFKQPDLIRLQKDIKESK